MLDTHELHDMIDVIDHVLDGGGLPVPDEVADTADPHDAASGGKLSDRFVRLQPRVVVERTTVGMSDRDRLPRDLDRIERRAIAAV